MESLYPKSYSYYLTNSLVFKNHVKSYALEVQTYLNYKKPVEKIPTTLSLKIIIFKLTFKSVQFNASVSIYCFSKIFFIRPTHARSFLHKNIKRSLEKKG